MLKKAGLVGVLSSSILGGCVTTEIVRKGPFYEFATVQTFFTPEQVVISEGMMPAPNGFAMMSYSTRGVIEATGGVNLFCDSRQTHGIHTIVDKNLLSDWFEKNGARVKVTYDELYSLKKRKGKVEEKFLRYEVTDFKELH